METPFAGWESFYVILGSSAAALTGLQFVVIALGAEAEVIGGEPELNAFATPTIVHFCAVLLIAAFIAMPGQTAGSMSLCLTISALAGFVYAMRVMLMARRTTGYVPVLEDWIWHAALPIFSYACLIVAGIIVSWRPKSSLYFVGAIAMLLLFIGIHNAWDAAIFMTMRRKKD